MLTRYEPMTSLFNEAISLREAMDRLFENSFLRPSFARGGALSVPVDVYEDADHYYVQAYLPGVDPEALNITAQDNTLSIAGEIRRELPEGQQVLWQETPVGQFRREITLPLGFDVNACEAQYHNGVLYLSVPKAERFRPKAIKVRSGSHEAPQLVEQTGGRSRK